MEIRFKKLIIKNFKGVTSLAVNFLNDVTCIMGANHTGKTTTADAINWVLFGKNSQGLTTFGIDPKDQNNDIIHHLDNSVELVMTVFADTQSEISLKKIRKEIWSKQRGSDQETLTGHSVDCFVNGEKVTAKDYQSYVDGICKEALFKAITSPEYFPKLKADSQRILLVKMVGMKSLADIAAENSDLKSLLGKINGDDEAAIERYREHLAYSMKEVKKELQAIPPRISENADIVNKIRKAGSDFDVMRKQLDDVNKSIADCDKQLADATAIINADYDERAAKRKEINECRTAMVTIENRYTTANRDAEDKHNKEVRALQSQLDDINFRLGEEQNAAKRYQSSLDDIELRKDDFRKRWQEVEDMEFVMAEDDDKCPTCGQTLPDDMLEHKREELEKNFNLSKAAKQDKLDEEAKQIKDDQERLTARLENSQRLIDKMQEQVAKTHEQLDGAKSVVVEKKSYKDDAEYLKWSDRLSKLQEELDNMTSLKDNSQTIIGKKQELMNKRDEILRQLNNEKELKEREARIAELEETQRTLNQQLTNYEKEDSSAERFEHAVIADLENRVNELFSTIRFKMFEQLINGNVRPTCQLTMHGVPYADLSHSEKILAGLECVRAMQRHTGVHAPIIIDNCESVNRFPDDIGCQMILLYVSTDRELKIVEGI